MISEIMVESGTIMAIGRNMLLRLSGSSVRPAYPAHRVLITKNATFDAIKKLTRVHSDEDATTVIQFDFTTLKNESLGPIGHGLEYGHDLLCND